MGKERILIVEDEPSLTQVLSYNLQREGYEIVVTHDGREGLRSLALGLAVIESSDRRDVVAWTRPE